MIIVKIKAKAADMPVDQRAKVLLAEFNRVIVELCGPIDHPVKVIQPSDIVGVELSEQLAISFSKPVFCGSNCGSPLPT